MASICLQILCLFSLFCVFQAQVNFRQRILRPFPIRRQHPLSVLDPNPPPRFVLLGPNLLRTDHEENFYLEANGLSDPLSVTITFADFPARQLQLHKDTVLLNKDNNYKALKAVNLPSHQIFREERSNTFVYLTVDFGSHLAEKVLMVSFQSGYIFVQTDKPIFNPGDIVNYRAFVSTPAFQASNSSISIEVQNPEGMTIHAVFRTIARNGIFSENYKLSDIANEGTWKIIAKFDNWHLNKFSYEFEVKKYVLPAFNVTLTPKKSYFSVDDSELEVDVTARYLYGEPVKGYAYIVFGVEVNKEKRRLPDTIQRVEDLEQGKAVLKMADIKRVFPNIRELVGCPIYVKASVLTSSGSDLVEAESSGIKITESPFLITFRNTPEYFKPGLPFDMTVQVTLQDGSLAPNIPFQLSMQSQSVTVTTHRGVSRVILNMPQEIRPQTIIAKTTASELKPEHQAKHQLVVQPYMPFSNAAQNYLYISVGTERVSAGDRVSLELHLRNSIESHKDLIKHFTYLVMNKGKIITADRLPMSGQQVTSFSLDVTPEMIPSFRVVVFYILPWVGTSEVVADSVWVDVEDTCMGMLKVGKGDGRGLNTYRPGESFRFEVKGDPGARVSLLAVDNAVFLLNNRYRLTQSKLWDVVEKADIGCSPGSGRDSVGVFQDAGLMFHSNNARVTEGRQGLQCTKPTRRRSVRTLQNKAALEDQYKDWFLQKCCKDGMREIPMEYSCVRRSHYISESWECIQAFLQCCSQYQGEPLQLPFPTTTRAPSTTISILHLMPKINILQSRVMTPYKSFRMETFQREKVFSAAVSERFDAGSAVSAVEDYEEEEEDDVVNEREVYVRSKFFETWLWNEISLPDKPEAAGKDGLVSYTVQSVLPDSITEWGILAVSSSLTKGFCVAKPYSIIAKRQFFVDLRLPYSVARNEQVEVKAVLYNYGDEDLQVIVILYKTLDICSVAHTENHRQEVTLRAQSSSAIPYTIVPLKAGKLELEVKALTRDLLAQDGVRKTLNVVLEGVQKTKVQSFILNPSLKAGSDGIQVINIDNIKVDSVVPNSFPATYINVRGNVLADTIDNSISDDSLGSLLRMPGGCVEQNLASMTLPLIATHYLDRAHQWETVGVQRRLDAVQYIKKGYEKQLMYAKKDNSYPPYRNVGTSTWITAYVVKVFSMAHPVVYVNEKHICGPLLYLLKQKQMPDGAFSENNPVYAAAMTGGLQGTESSATLTAFVLIAMSEAKAVVKCQEPGIVTEEQMRKAVNYLKIQLPRLSRPYSVAITAYALALMGEDKNLLRDQLQRAASADKTHWPDLENPLFTLEATGYSLLAHVKMGDIERAGSIFQWLNERRKLGGGYGSTQPTMVVLQGLSDYLIQKPPPLDMNLKVALSIPGRRDTHWTFSSKSAYVARSAKASIDQKFTVEASGTGQGILEVVTIYNELPDVSDKKSCPHFDLEVTVKQDMDRKTSEDTEKYYRLDISVRSLEPSEIRMAVLDITLPTGFVPNTEDLEKLSNSVDRYINNFEIMDGLSDRGSLIIHLFKVSNTEREIISFGLLQKFSVGLIQPSSVTVYEYYNTDHRCTKFYSPLAEKAELQQICKDEKCHCSEGNCCTLKTQVQSITNSMRKDEACRSIYHVYKVRVLRVSRSQYDRYDVEILQVIKEGKQEGIQVKDKNIFLSHAACRGGLDLQEGGDYLIMGLPEDIWYLDATTNRFTYILGKKTWVESWPSDAECQADTMLKQRCSQLEEFASDLLEKGCQS